jgi:hypothetical protein
VTSTPSRDRGLRLVWSLFAVVAGSMALLAVIEWTDALLSGRPILYGEGAVAHAAILFRDGSAYRDTTGTVAANYPPLYLAIASLGDPFRSGRAATILSVIAVAGLAAWRARPAGGLASAGLALGWLALAPVAIWGAAVKPDLFAVALTFAGALLLDRSRAGGPGAFAAGALLELALWAKPTAALPALALLAWAAIAARRSLGPLLGGFFAVAAIGLVSVIALGPADLWRHVVAWNVLPWSAEQTGLVLVLGAATLGIVIAVAVMANAFRGIALAYALGALATVALAGREGATINYLLDLAAATIFALVRAAPRLRASAALPVAGMVQLAIAVALLTPFGIVPGRAPTTGAWGQPERGEVMRALGPGSHLVEDSGLLIAAGRDPVIDDLFLWSRLVSSGAIDPSPIVGRVQVGGLASIVSEADLEHLDRAPAYERARWDPSLVSWILSRYVLERSTGVLWVYRPR